MYCLNRFIDDDTGSIVCVVGAHIYKLTATSLRFDSAPGIAIVVNLLYISPTVTGKSPMSKEAPNATWYEEFFTGAALDLWRLAVTPEATEQEVAFLQEALETPVGGHLLDVPCGNGRLSLPMSLLGYQVTGIDTCEEFIKEAKEKAVAYESTVNFAVGDMRKLDEPGKYDGAFCMGNSFGYFDRSGTMQFLEAVYKSLKPDSQFILDSQMIAECFLVNGGEREWVQRGDMYMLVDNHYDAARSFVETEYTFIKGGKEEKRKSTHWIYTAGELSHMCEQAGFTVVEMFGSAECEPFELGAERMLLVARKN